MPVFALGLALGLSVDRSPQGLSVLYDGSAPVAQVEAVQAPPPKEPVPLVEPPFDDSWRPIARDLWDRRRAKRGLRALAERFAADEESETGLCADAPEALRLLTLALRDGMGGPEAPAELRRELAKAAALEPEEKQAFAAKLASPVTVYIALSRSKAAHAADARFYFARMEALLAASGRTLPGFIAETDPHSEDSARFLLRAHAYDLLVPRLNRHPTEAAALPALLFPAGRDAELPPRAAALEGLMTQLGASGRRSGALDAFVGALEERAAASPPPSARRIALYLALNERLLPAGRRAAADALAQDIPGGVLGKAPPPEPYTLWPGAEWRFALHFASTSSYSGWFRFFTDRGWTPAPAAEGAAVEKDFGGLRVVLNGRLFPGDEEGFLRGEEAKRFLAAVSRDLRDPSIQGVMLRNHAQFRVANLLGPRTTKGKLILDGSCRSAWDLQLMRKRCPSCYLVANTGTGQGHVNNEAVLAVVEGLAAHETWAEVGEDWERALPRGAARLQGPWTPSYEDGLRALERTDKGRGAPAAR